MRDITLSDSNSIVQVQRKYNNSTQLGTGTNKNEWREIDWSDGGELFLQIVYGMRAWLWPWCGYRFVQFIGESKHCNARHRKDTNGTWSIPRDAFNYTWLCQKFCTYRNGFLCRRMYDRNGKRIKLNEMWTRLIDPEFWFVPFPESRKIRLAKWNVRWRYNRRHHWFACRRQSWPSGRSRFCCILNSHRLLYASSIRMPMPNTMKWTPKLGIRKVCILRL